MDNHPINWQKDMFDQVFATSHGRVLRFLARQSGRSFYEREIQEATGLSRSAVNLAARALYQAGLLQRQRRGRMNFYAADDRHPFVRQFKVLDTIASLEGLLHRLRPLARRIILFGSCAQGMDRAESDVDLFILTTEREAVRAVVRESRMERALQAVIADLQELAELKERDATFYAAIQRGLVLWEVGDELGT